MPRDEPQISQSARNLGALMQLLCKRPELLAAFREDPRATACRLGAPLTTQLLDEMRALEEDAVTDIVWDPQEGNGHV